MTQSGCAADQVDGMDKIGHANSPDEAMPEAMSLSKTSLVEIWVAKFQDLNDCCYCEGVGWPGMCISPTEATQEDS